MSPSDYRTKSRTISQEYSLSLKSFSDSKRMEEYVKVLVAGGLSERWVRRYLRRRKARLIRRLKRLRIRGSKEKMTSFWAIPFFLVTGKR